MCVCLRMYSLTMHIEPFGGCATVSQLIVLSKARGSCSSVPLQPTSLVPSADPSPLYPSAPYRLHDAEMPNYEAYRSY